VRNLSIFLKRADTRIRAVRLAHPGVFWAVVVAIVPVAIVVVLAPLVWEGYSANRENITPIATFIGAAVLAYAALKQAATASRRHFAQTEADRQRRIVESFTKAVEQLGSDKLEVRVGAIFALERLSKESPDDYWTVMEVLAAFVRDHMRYTTIIARLSERAYFLWLQAGRPEGRSEELWAEAVRLERLEETPTDIAAIFTVIKRRSAEDQEREQDRWFDLSRTYLRKTDLTDVNLKKANFFEAHLEGAALNGAHLEGANLNSASLVGALLLDTHLEGAYLWDAHLEGAILPGAHLEGADLQGAHLEGADLQGAHFEGANLREAHLEGVSLRDAHLEGAKLPEAHLKRADLQKAHLERAELWYAYLERAELEGAHLERAMLTGAHLEDAAFWGAHLQGATLWDAHLEGAILQETHLEGAELMGAHLKGARTWGAHLEGAILQEAHLEGADLRNAVGLTDDQLVGAFGDGKTQLPEGITRPNSWPPLQT